MPDLRHGVMSAVYGGSQERTSNIRAYSLDFRAMSGSMTTAGEIAEGNLICTIAAEISVPSRPGTARRRWRGRGPVP
jgi:hypothetical protein